MRSGGSNRQTPRQRRQVDLERRVAIDAVALDRRSDVGQHYRRPVADRVVRRVRRIDQLRRRKMLDRKHEHLGRELEERQVSPESDLAEAIDDHVGDDLLRLIFTTCHPVLTTEARVALTLRLLGGLTTDEIARAFLQPKTAIQQRIVRAKRTLAAARVPFEVPARAELAGRLASVLEVIYTSSSTRVLGDGGGRVGPAGAVRRCAAPGPHSGRACSRGPEVHGLVALMEDPGIAHSRAGGTRR
jgi:predicted RNA polymerase sigma factor